jgi:phage protein D
MSQGRLFAADPVITAPGPLPPAWAAQLVSCVVDENVGLPDAATISFRDPDHELLTKTNITIGTKLTVSVMTVDGGGQDLLFGGEVTALELDSDPTGSFTVVRALSRAHRLFRGRKVVAYRNMTAAAIVRKVATAAGLTVGKVDAAPITYTQLTQPNVTDWEFLTDLAQEQGATVRVDRTGRLDFTALPPASGAPAPSTPATRNPLVLEYGRNLVVLRAALTAADQVETVEVRGWNVSTKTALVARQPARTSTTVAPGLPTAAAQAYARGSSLLVTDTPYGTQAEAMAAARSLAETASAGLGELEAVVQGNPDLRAGTAVALGNAGPQFSGRYTATAVHHVLEPTRGYRTTVLVSASPDRSLTGLVTGANAAGRGPRIPGLAIGVVTDIKEAGGQRGWVKLTFPWLADDYVTDWVRTVQYGGSGGGGVISPDVNDEVLVGFEQGCLDRPYVLGGLYNGVDKPSDHSVPLVDRTSGKVNRRSLVSRKGHRLELLDTTTGSDGVRLASGDKRLEVTMDERAKTITLTVHGPAGAGSLSSVTMTDRGITVDAGAGALVLKGRSVSVTGTTDVTVDGGALGVLRAALVRIN